MLLLWVKYLTCVRERNCICFETAFWALKFGIYLFCLVYRRYDSKILIPKARYWTLFSAASTIHRPFSQSYLPKTHLNVILSNHSRSYKWTTSQAIGPPKFYMYFSSSHPSRILTVFKPSRFHYSVLCDLYKSKYSSPHFRPIRMLKSRWMGWAGHVAHVEEVRNVVGKLERKPLGRRRLGWEENITFNHKEIRFEPVGCIHLA